MSLNSLLEGIAVLLSTSRSCKFKYRQQLPNFNAQRKAIRILNQNLDARPLQNPTTTNDHPKLIQELTSNSSQCTCIRIDPMLHPNKTDARKLFWYRKTNAGEPVAMPLDDIPDRLRSEKCC